MVAALLLAIGPVGDSDLRADELRFLGPLRLEVALFLTLLRNETLPHTVVTMHLADGAVRTVESRPGEEGGELFGIIPMCAQFISSEAGIAPQNQLDDGTFEIEFMKKSNFASFLCSLLLVADGGRACNHVLGDTLVRVKVKKAVFEFFEGGKPRPGFVAIDGERYLHDGRLELAIRPGRVRLIVDRDAVGGTTATYRAAAVHSGASPTRWLVLAAFVLGGACSQAVARASLAAAGHGALVSACLELAASLLMLLPVSRAVDGTNTRTAAVLGSVMTLCGAVALAVATSNSALVAGACASAAGQPFFLHAPANVARAWFPNQSAARLAFAAMCALPPLLATLLQALVRREPLAQFAIVLAGCLILTAPVNRRGDDVRAMAEGKLSHAEQQPPGGEPLGARLVLPFALALGALRATPLALWPQMVLLCVVAFGLARRVGLHAAEKPSLMAGVLLGASQVSSCLMALARVVL